MNEPFDGGECHGWLRKDRIPFPEGLFGGYQHGASFVTDAEEFEEHAGLGLILGDVGDIIADQQAELVELCDGALPREPTARCLAFWDIRPPLSSLRRVKVPHVGGRERDLPGLERHGAVPTVMRFVCLSRLPWVWKLKVPEA